MTNNEKLLIALRLIQAFEAEGKKVTHLLLSDHDVTFNCGPYQFGYDFRTKNHVWYSYSAEMQEPLSETIVNIITML